MQGTRRLTHLTVTREGDPEALPVTGATLMGGIWHWALDGDTPKGGVQPGCNITLVVYQDVFRMSHEITNPLPEVAAPQAVMANRLAVWTFPEKVQ